MKKIKKFLLITGLYAASAHSTFYSCDIFNNHKKITALTGEIANNTNIDPNNALAFTLCQQAGFKPINVLISIPGIRQTTSITKNQLIPNPACTLKCTQR